MRLMEETEHFQGHKHQVQPTVLSPRELHMKPLTVQFSGFSERVRKMHHTSGVKRPAGMGGPHCDHSPSSLICSHYPYQRLKIKNKDRESDGGQREAAAEREWGK